MVALCLCDNALVIHTHYSNGCRYKDLLTCVCLCVVCVVCVVCVCICAVAASPWLKAACILHPLPSDCLPLQQPALPLQLTSLTEPLLKWWGESFLMCLCFLWLMLA